MTRWLSATAILLVLGASVPARAQRALPSEPLAFGDGRVTLGADVSASFAPQDLGFFNSTDSDHSTLRMIRLALIASVKAGDHISFLTEIRTENFNRPEPYACYVRIRPWTDRNFDIQVGRVPPTF